MQTNESNSSEGYHLKVDQAGRVVVPAAIRTHYNIRTGDILILRSGDKGLELRTYEQLMREAQDYFSSLVPAGRRLSDELIEERRREAETE